MRPYLGEFRELWSDFPSGKNIFERVFRPWAKQHAAILAPLDLYRQLNEPHRSRAPEPMQTTFGRMTSRF